MQRMKVAYAALCIATVMAAGECTTTKVKNPPLKSQFHWKNMDPNIPEFKETTNEVLKNATCPNSIPCKPVEIMGSVRLSNDARARRYDVVYFTPQDIERKMCEIFFEELNNNEIPPKRIILSWYCNYFRPPPPTRD